MLIQQRANTDGVADSQLPSLVLFGLSDSRTKILQQHPATFSVLSTLNIGQGGQGQGGLRFHFECAEEVDVPNTIAEILDVSNRTRTAHSLLQEELFSKTEAKAAASPRGNFGLCAAVESDAAAQTGVRSTRSLPAIWSHRANSRSPAFHTLCCLFLSQHKTQASQTSIPTQQQKTVNSSGLLVVLLKPTRQSANKNNISTRVLCSQRYTPTRVGMLAVGPTVWQPSLPNQLRRAGSSRFNMARLEMQNFQYLSGL